MADSRPETADFRPEKADFRPERADFRPERAWGDGQTNKQTNQQTNKRKSPVFYRTSSPLGPLPKKGTDQPTDRRTDIAGVESRSTRLKIYVG